MKVHLTSKKCIPCEDGIKPLTKEAIAYYLPQLKNKWEVIDDKKIKYSFRFRDFTDAMQFVNKVADLAENEGHHPNIYIYYSRVVIELTTHAIGGLSENDFILAAKIERVCV